MPAPSAAPTSVLPRILAVFHDAGLAGAELVLLHHLIALQAHGADIVAVLPRRGPLAAVLTPIARRLYFHAAPWWIRLQGSRTHARAWDAAARGGLSRRLDKSVAALSRIVAAEQPEVVVVAAAVLLSPSLAAHQAGVPCLQFVHEWPGAPPAATGPQPLPAAADIRWDSPLAWADALAVLRAVNRRLIWSSPACALAWQDPALPYRATPAELASAWQARQAAHPIETFLPHPVDWTPYTAPANRPAAAPGKTPLRLTCVATWSWRKGLDLLPPLLDALHQAGVAFQLTLVGHAPADNFTRCLRRWLQAAPWAAAVRCQAYADNLPALFVATDLLLHPAREDTGPLILAHAMAAGVAILASDLPGIRELLSGYALAPSPAATLLPAADTAAWSAWLLKHANAESIDRLRAAAAQNRELARAVFSAPVVEQRFRDLLQEARNSTLNSVANIPVDTAQLAASIQDRLAAAHEHTAGAALWAWRDEAVDFGRSLLARLQG